jgi:hypothetical protein
VAKRNKQTGTPNPKNYSKGSGKINRTRSPWGTPGVAARVKGAWGKVYGSSRRQSRPAPEERGMQYPVNQPSQWPVEIDRVNHTLAPPLSGYVTNVANKNNAAVEHAYTRAKYQ